MNCIICNSKNSLPLVNVNFFQRIHDFLINESSSLLIAGHCRLNYLYCLGCGLIFQEFPPDEGILSSFYQNWRSDISIDKFKEYTQMKIRLHRNVINWLEKETSLLQQKGRMLDVGTADGSLCDLFRQKGWGAVGVEQTHSMAKNSRIFYKDIDIIEQPYEKKLFPPQYFDLIVFSLSLEHFRNPAEVIQTCSFHLKPNGYVYIQVPTFMSKNFTEFSSSHFYIFTRDNLSLLLSLHGYQITNIRFFLSRETGRRNLCVLCQKKINPNKQASTIYLRKRKKEYIKFRLLVLYRYFTVFIIYPISSIFKKSLKLIISKIFSKR